MPPADVSWLKEHVRDIPDFPKPGVVFKDITPLLAEPKAFSAVVDGIAEAAGFAPIDTGSADIDTGSAEIDTGSAEIDTGSAEIDKVLGIEARGFIVAAPVAYRFGAGFVPVRKAGKLPWHIEKTEYELEYGTDLLEIHRDAVQPGERVLIVDDVLATGGTAAATVRLVEQLGGTVAGLGFIIELRFLGGRSKLEGQDVVALIGYD